MGDIIKLNLDDKPLEYTVDFGRKMDDFQHKTKDIYCGCYPFGIKLPIKLNLIIKEDGELAFGKWLFYPTDEYDYKLESDYISPFDLDRVLPFTQAQTDTIIALNSGEKDFEGIKIDVAPSLLKLSGLNIESQIKLTPINQIYANGGIKGQDSFYCLDLDRACAPNMEGDLNIHGGAFGLLPIEMNLAIRMDGEIVFKGWEFHNTGFYALYFHTSQKPEDIIPTEEQVDTVNALWSGRKTFEGLKLSIGATVQEICPIDVDKEEKLLHKKIWLNHGSRNKGLEK